MRILGIWDGHDSGAALLVDGRLCAAVNEERLTRRKLEIRFPGRSIQTCLEIGGLRPSQIDLVAVSTSDVAKTLSRWVPATKESYYAVRRRHVRGGALAALRRRAKYLITEWPGNALTRRLSTAALVRDLGRCGIAGRLQLLDHHACHAFAALHSSGMSDGLVVTVDGLGDGLSCTVSAAVKGRMTRVAASPAAHSLGMFFEHVTYLLNMRELEDEGKVMALADYAAEVSEAENPLLALIAVENATIRLRYTGYRLYGALRALQWKYPNEQFALMAQRALERACLALVTQAIDRTGLHDVAVSGGVFSNIKVNRLLRLSPAVRDLYVFPHMGDGGLPLGAAIGAAAELGEPLEIDLGDLGWGQEFTEENIAGVLAGTGLASPRPDDLPSDAAALVADGRIVLWFQGRMEYGPRALGHRSILARADLADIRDRLNLILKRRVWYQPFCPSLLESEARRVLSDYTAPSNWAMTMAYEVRSEYRSRLAATLSIDGLCRPQIVPDEAPGPFAALLRAVHRRTGFGGVLNTSFNIHGEPLVCTPTEAVAVYQRSIADALAIGPFLLQKAATAGDRVPCAGQNRIRDPR